MDTEKIFSGIVEQSSVNDMKNELINLKGYLNTIDVKITSLNNEYEKKQNELSNIIDEINNLKDAILANCNSNYEKQLEELVNDKLKKSQIHIDLINSYERYIKKTFFNQETASNIKSKEIEAEKEYEESVLKENKFKEEYNENIEDFEIFINYYLEDESRIFDKENNNEFEIFKDLEYFDSQLLDNFINLFVIRERLIMERDKIKKEISINKEEKNNITEKIKELDLKVSSLLLEREACIDAIDGAIEKTADVLEKGVKQTVKVGKFAYNYIKGKVNSNISCEESKDNKENKINSDILNNEENDKKSNAPENSKDSKKENILLEAAIDSVLFEGKKRIKSFFNDKKNK